MTHFAGVRELVLRVVGIVRRRIAGLMARPAILRRAGELPSCMTLRARHTQMSSRERIARQIMIKRGRPPRLRGVALSAVLR